MPVFFHHDLTGLVERFGDWAVVIAIAVESVGFPLPGESMLLTAAIVAGSSHAVSIGGVIGAATAAAFVGGDFGFWLGRRLGYRWLYRHGARIGITHARLKLGRYLFLRHGGKVVFFGRFVALLRVLAPVLAGANFMPWKRFLAANLAGAATWATTLGLGGYLLGEALRGTVGAVSATILALAGILVVALIVLVRRHERELLVRAEAALPGPLEDI